MANSRYIELRHTLCAPCVTRNCVVHHRGHVAKTVTTRGENHQILVISKHRLQVVSSLFLWLLLDRLNQWWAIFAAKIADLNPPHDFVFADKTIQIVSANLNHFTESYREGVLQPVLRLDNLERSGFDWGQLTQRDEVYKRFNLKSRENSPNSSLVKESIQLLELCWGLGAQKVKNMGT